MLGNALRKRGFIEKALFFSAGWMLVAVSTWGQPITVLSGGGTQAPKVPTFEVVSVRPNKSGKGFALTFTPDGFITTNMPLQPVIINAYNLRDHKLMVGGQLIPGGPSWINSDRYDIQAKISESDIAELQKLSVSQQLAQKRLMLQSMLADRFKLKVHREIKQAPCFALVIAKNGSKMKEVKANDPTVPDEKLSARPGVITAQGASMARLIFVLTGPLSCPVVDKTGLMGKYDFALRYSPDQGSSPMFLRSEGRQQEPESTPDTFGPSLFTAVQEQLGLRLIPTTVSVEDIVIEHVEKPSEN
jgi:uncharacterized protein (TIGR03435 family)